MGLVDGMVAIPILIKAVQCIAFIREIRVSIIISDGSQRVFTLHTDIN